MSGGEWGKLNDSRYMYNTLKQEVAQKLQDFLRGHTLFKKKKKCYLNRSQYAFVKTTAVGFLTNLIDKE